MEHFLSTGDWSSNRLEAFLQTAANVKSGADSRTLDGKTLGMLFFNSSLRTRTSFEVGMFQLGGHAVNLTVGSGMWNLEHADGVVMDGDKAEHIREAAPVLSRYVELLGIRAFAEGNDWEHDRTDPVLAPFAEHATVPVINMESSLWHPCQALADALTWNELGVEKGAKVVLTWTWHPRALPMAVPNSAALVAAQRGMNLVIHRPDAYALDADVMQQVNEAAATSGGSVEETNSLDGLDDAVIVYAKSWGSLQAYGDAGAEAKLRADLRDWQVTMDWMNRTEDGKFMHCLPVRRNVVVADEVLDSHRSAVVDQAENRMHVQKALMLELGGA